MRQQHQYEILPAEWFAIQIERDFMRRINIKPRRGAVNIRIPPRERGKQRWQQLFAGGNQLQQSVVNQRGGIIIAARRRGSRPLPMPITSASPCQ